MELTVEITDFCTEGCDYCSTNAHEEGTFLDVNTIYNFVRRACAEHKVERINISGGEPVAHPDFYNILQFCKGFCKNTWVYTNTIEQLMYNTGVIKEVKVEANVCLTPGRHVYIPKNVNKAHLLQLVSQGRASSMTPVTFHVSGNINGCNRCKECNHQLLQADGEVVEAPCKKDY